MKKVKEPASLVAAIEVQMPFGELLHEIKTGRAGASKLRAATEAIDSVESIFADKLEIAPLQRCMIVMHLCFHAKDGVYRRGTDDHAALTELYDALSLSLIGVAPN